MPEVKTLRTDSVRVKLAPAMLDRVEKLAIDFGMPTATLCAFAVAQFVQTEESKRQNVQTAVSSLVETMQTEMASRLDDSERALMASPEFASFIDRASRAALSQPNLPLDGEAPRRGA